MTLNIEEQYDKIYRYCYFKLHSTELAEDVTQETFLRYLEHYSGVQTASAIKYLYTIARNLCADEYRKPKTEPIDESAAAGVSLGISVFLFRVPQIICQKQYLSVWLIAALVLGNGAQCAAMVKQTEEFVWN